MAVIFRIIRIIFGICGMILFMWFFIPGVLTGHIHIGVVTGVIISVVLVLYAAFARPFHRFIRYIWKYIAAKILLIIIAAAITAIIVLAVMCMISIGRGMKNETVRSYTEEQHAAATGSDAGNGINGNSGNSGGEQADNMTVVVLGCRVYSYGPSLMLKARLNAALGYLSGNPDSACIVCGGRGKNEPVTEASAMFDYLAEKGINPSRIYIDDTSLDTLENLKNAYAIIEAEGIEPKCAIVTSDYHCYRAVKYAERLGFEEPAAIPADTLWWLFPSSYVREMYGILEMWFLN